MGFTTIQEDKFNKTKTITWNAWDKKPSMSSQLHAQASLGIIWYLDSIVLGGVEEGLGMGMRIIEKEGIRSIIIDYEYHRWEWMHIGRGELKILIDNNEVIDLKGHEIRTQVYTSAQKGGKIFEKGYWALSEIDFKKICDAKKVDVRITGGSGFFIEFPEAHNNSFLYMLRTMYNEAIDSTHYTSEIEAVNKANNEKSKSDAKWGKGCLIVIVVVILLAMLKMCS